MEIIPVACNHCAAPLQIPASSPFVTCRFCGSSLKLVQGEGVYYTEILRQVRDEIRDLAGDLEQIKWQNELERLDREWLLEREGHLTRDRQGNPEKPEGANLGCLVLILPIGFLLFFIGSANSIGAPAIFPLFGFGMLILIVIGALKQAGKADDYEEAENRYRSRRQELLKKLGR
ncbi:MAG: hypothetical protein RL095_1897 [Verrucomicrobiota bacterium]|jgi:hypothetical protein